MTRLLEPGLEVQLERDDGVELDWQVAEVVRDGVVLVGSSATPLAGERVSIAWGSAEGAFRGVTRVLEAEEGLRVVVELPDQVRRAQRRRFHRVPCTAPFRLLTDGEPQVGSTRDVSANGLCGQVRGDRPPSDLDLQLTLPFGVVAAPARVVRCRELGRAGLQIALAFVPDRRSEDQIAAFVLERERELLRVRRSSSTLPPPDPRRRP
jgi:hypothetical protein